MAQRLDTMPKRRGRATVHPWDEWADGSAWEVKAGEDFDAELESFRTQLYGKARSLGKKVDVSVNKAEKTISFQFLPLDPES